MLFNLEEEFIETETRILSLSYGYYKLSTIESRKKRI